jgi:hypothetical protein
MYVGILFTEGSMKSYSACREKILGYEQRGLYTSPEQFNNSNWHCHTVDLHKTDIFFRLFVIRVCNLENLV